MKTNYVIMVFGCQCFGGEKEWRNKDLYDPFGFGNSISSKMICLS